MTQKIFPAIINTTGATSGQYLKNVSGTAVWAEVEGGTWGSITGDITQQIDLGNALAGKLPSSAVSTFGLDLIDSIDAQAARATLGLVDSVEGLNPLALTTSLIPATDAFYDLGSTTHRWKDIFVSANTIYLGDGTQLSGTSIVVDGGPNPTSLADMPTIKASKIVAVPFTYFNGGPVYVRPSIEFQIGADIYPISLNTETFEFSLDAQGNYGTGSLVAKKVTLSNAASIALMLTGGLVHDGSYLNASTTSTFRFDGNTILGYSAAQTITLKGNTIFEGGVQFAGATTIGDGNDTVSINAGTNPFTIVSDNFSVDAIGNTVIDGNLTVHGTTTTINSNTINLGDNIIVLNADIGVGDSPIQNAGIQVARGEEASARWLWDENLDVWSPMGGNLGSIGTVTATSFVGNLTGNATTATSLQTARNINGVAFDGTADITVTDSTKLNASAAGTFGLTVLGTGTSAAATALLDIFTPSLKGLVPPPSTATGAFLKDDGTWAEATFNLTDGTKGEITVSAGGTVWTIDANVITTAKIQQIATNSFLGRDTDGTGNVEVLSVETTRSVLNISNVDNTSDANKPISTAVQVALNTKVNKGLITGSDLTMSSGALVGRSTGSTGSVEEIVVGNGLSIVGSQLSVSFPDNGWGTSVTATGTAVPQNIELPESGLSPLDVMVFNDGIRFYTDEYTIVGTTLTMTSNFAGDKIEIVKLPTRTILSEFQPARGVMSDSSLNYTPSSTAITRYVRLTNNSPVTVFIPDSFSIGTELVFEQAGAGNLTIVGASGVTVYSRGNRIQSAGQYAVVNVKKVDAISWVISGDVV